MKTVYKDKYIDIGANKIRYLDSGSVDSGKTLVLLSGWPVSCNLFTGFIDEMAPYCRCIAVDLPGWGESSDKENVFHSIDYYADFLDKFVSKIIHGEGFTVFGYSTGGVIGVLYTYKYKKNKFLVVYSPPLNGRSHINNRFKQHKKTGFLFFLFKTLPWLLEAIKHQPFKYLITKIMIGNIYGSLSGNSVEEKRQIEEIVITSQGLSPRAVFDVAVDLKKENYVPLLSKIDIPVLFMSSANDTAVPPQEVKGFYDNSKNGQYRVFEKYNHFIVLDNPTVLVQAIVDFMEK